MGYRGTTLTSALTATGSPPHHPFWLCTLTGMDILSRQPLGWTKRAGCGKTGAQDGNEFSYATVCASVKQDLKEKNNVHL